VKAPEAIKIVIVGDFLIFRVGLKLVLKDQEFFEVVGEASDLSEALNIGADPGIDIFLIDSAAIENGSFSTFISSLGRHVPVLVLTSSKIPGDIQKFLELGVNGVFSKDEAAETLFKAIMSVSAGEMWFQRKLMLDTIHQLVRAKEAAPSKPYSFDPGVLSSREREVLHLICRGMKNKAIADSLFITETTVRHHLTSIFEKLNVCSRLELVVRAFNDRLVEIPGNGNNAVAGLKANTI
jgi:two-component system NarL family response regulator